MTHDCSKVEHFAALSYGLMSLSGCVNEFAWAMQLFRHCHAEAKTAREEEQNVPRMVQFLHWQLIAAREAVMQVFHFRDLLIGISETARKAGAADLKFMRLQRARFDAAFPHYDDMRNAVAHAGEAASTAAQLKKNAFKGDHNQNGMSFAAVDPTFVTSVLGDDFALTHEGRIYTISISDDSHQKLQSIYSLVSLGLAPLLGSEPSEAPA